MAKYFADISSYQRSDLQFFQNFVSHGVGSVFIKTTQGSADGSNYLNPKARTQAKNALAAGMNVGFYHYFLATGISDAIKEAKFFDQSVANLGFGKNTPLCVDVEDPSLNKSNVSGYVDTFINYLKEHGYTNIVQYAMASWFWGNNPVLNASKHPTWVANYGVNAVGVSGNVIGWQYTSSWSSGGQDMSYDWGIFDKEIDIDPPEVATAPPKPKVENVIKLIEDVHPVDSLGSTRPIEYKKDSMWESDQIKLINDEPHYRISTNVYIPISKTEFSNVVIVNYLEGQPAPLFNKDGKRVVNDGVTIGKAFKYDQINIINGIPMARVSTNEYLPFEYTSGSDFV
ncbi:GH25 family lysozyme [Companilactobacillus baiquanensis]|uniref:GH25 family lysozyme n=1 Tax=Companilactobacillus baiquanensis TaxID=2486005 RepID=A0ABW1V0F2_9LACO|nr:GH25 family lysozyme [Companilactobacillus baiquanensis]